MKNLKLKNANANENWITEIKKCKLKITNKITNKKKLKLNYQK